MKALMTDGNLLNEILRTAPLFMLTAVRALALIETAPLLSSDSIPQTAKIALAGFSAFCVLPSVPGANLPPGAQDPAGGAFSLNFLLLVTGEAVIGIITGFIITIVFSAFSTAGQFFSLQMGFGASETFDPLSQTENPLLGQFLNIAAMLVFLLTGAFRDLFITGFAHSVEALNITELIAGREKLAAILTGGLARLFLDAIMISMPILGTLFLTSLATGLVSKAAPQINILSEGFPISILVAFLLIFSTLPYMTESFSRITASAFRTLEDIFISTGGGIGR